MTRPVTDSILQLLIRHRPKLAGRLQTLLRSNCLNVSLKGEELTCSLPSGQAIDIPALRNRVDPSVLETVCSSDPIIVFPAGSGHQCRLRRHLVRRREAPGQCHGA